MTAAREYWVVKRGAEYLTSSPRSWNASRAAAQRYESAVTAWERAQFQYVDTDGACPRVVRVRVKKVRRPIEVGDCVRLLSGRLGLVAAHVPGGATTVWTCATEAIVTDAHVITLVARGKWGGK